MPLSPGPFLDSENGVVYTAQSPNLNFRRGPSAPCNDIVPLLRRFVAQPLPASLNLTKPHEPLFAIFGRK